MNLRDALRSGAEMLKLANIETPAVDAGVMLCHVLKKDRAYLYAHGEQELIPGAEGEYRALLQRRALGEPVQYLTGYQEFMGLGFRVNSHVLIPRPDTEVLVETVITHAKTLPARNGLVRILDMGTGSGCIAVSLAHYLPESVVTAVDISAGALSVAAANAENLGVKGRVTFLQSNLFEQMSQPMEYRKSFDIIVSNPPYIPEGDIPELQREVRGYEPRTALDGGPDGMDFYRELAAKGIEYLKEDGMLAFEVGYNQAEEVAETMKASFRNIEIVQDLAQINRVVIGRLK